MIAEQLAHKQLKLVLGSNSPRRAALLKDLGLTFSQRASSVDETYPSQLTAGAIATYLAELKARALQPELLKNELLITSDTVVWCDDRSLEKPQTSEEAIEMLSFLSGKTHEVYSAISISDRKQMCSEVDCTQVCFKTLSKEEIHYYVAHHEVMDKAGAYGIQDWIGLIGVKKLMGSYFNVMGLPTHLLYSLLKEWIED
jgi:septum formation protein